MKNYKQTSLVEIINDAKLRGTEAIETLKNLVLSTSIDKNGVEKPLSFIQIRRAYFEKFHKDLIPQPRKHKPSMVELILAL